MIPPVDPYQSNSLGAPPILLELASLLLASSDPITRQSSKGYSSDTEANASLDLALQLIKIYNSKIPSK